MESAGYDPADMITRSMRGQADALHQLFAMSQAGLDAASAQGYAAYLARVLTTIGDARFGDALSAEPQFIQNEVRFYLVDEVVNMFMIEQTDERGFGLIRHCFPVTFPQAAVEEADAWQIVRSSRSYRRVLARVEDAASVRLGLESLTDSDHFFWVWEDMGTHAVTLERLRVDSGGAVYRLNIVDDQWMREE